MPDLVIATRNQGKFDEIKLFFGVRNPDTRCLSLADFKNPPEVEEDGSSFLQNAQKKATIISTFIGKPALADDSGLEVEALGGRPGIYSSRFSGPHATDEQNMQKLLEKMLGLPTESRKARFRCSMVLRAPNGQSLTAVGDLEGIILEAQRGTGGFGYDPIFLVPETGRTLAEMTTIEKNRFSHRARALEKISQLLPGFFAGA